jgi:hypothetical protein
VFIEVAGAEQGISSNTPCQFGNVAEGFAQGLAASVGNFRPKSYERRIKVEVGEQNEFHNGP